MAQYKAFEPQVEVNGETVLSVVDGMGAYRSVGEKILKTHGIESPTPGQWYSQQAWLDAFKTIADRVGDSTLYEIGKKIPANAKFPPEVDSPEKALAAIDMAYHMNHRNGKIGNYSFQQTGPRSGKMTCDNPYPTEFDRGIIEAMAGKFSDVVDVALDQAASTRSSGGEADVYVINW
jgi:hypothetical protein